MRVAWPRREPVDLDALTQRAASAAVAEYRAEQERAAAEARAIVAEAQELQRQVMPGVPGLRQGGSLYPVYARDYPWRWSTPYAPHYRPGALVTIQTLRQFSIQYDILRAMINYLKDHVETVPFQIVARDDSDKSEKTKTRIKAAMDCFSVQGCVGGPGETRAEFEKKLIEDLLVVGVASVYLAPTRGGGVYESVAIDAGTIRPRVDGYGWPGPGQDWYEQYVEGIRQRGFTPEELYWKGLYPRTDSPYPDSPCEYLALTVLAAMSADTWNREWLTNGTEPGRMVGLPADMTPTNAQAWIDYFLARYSGNTRERQQLAFIPTGTGQIQNPTRRDHEFNEFMVWLARRCSAIMGVQLAAIGFPQGQFATTQAMSLEQTRQVGVERIVAFLTQFYDYLLGRLGYADLRARFITQQEEQAGDRATRNVSLVSGGVKTPNEARMEEGLDPMEGGDTLFIDSQFVPLEQAIAEPEPIPVNGNNAPMDGDQEPAAAERAALALWQRKALRRLSRSGSAACAFEAESIGDETRARVEDGLQRAATAADVRALFAAELVDLPPVYHTTAQQYERAQIGRRWRARRLAAEREA